MQNNHFNKSILPVNKYITASCVISKNTVFKEEKKIFEKQEALPTDLLNAVYDHLGIKYSKFYKMGSPDRLGWLAAEILLKDRDLKSIYAPEQIGIVLSNASASLDTDIKYYETVKDIPSPALFVYTLPNIIIGEISIRHGLKGENAFFINEVFDAEFINGYVSNLINNNILQACICGWVEFLKDEYKAVLFLVEKEAAAGAIPFTNENINKIYRLENG